MLLVAMTRAAREQLEAPDVVTHVRASHQADLGQIQQISIDGRAIETAPDQAIAELAVAERRASLHQMPEHLDPGQGRAKAGAPEDIPELIGFGRLHLGIFTRVTPFAQCRAPNSDAEPLNFDGDSGTVVRHTANVAFVCGFGSQAARRVGRVLLSKFDT